MFGFLPFSQRSGFHGLRPTEEQHGLQLMEALNNIDKSLKTQGARLFSGF